MAQVGPAPVEDELALAVRLRVRRGHGDDTVAPLEHQMHGEPARLLADAAGFLEAVEPRPLEEGGRICHRERIPLLLRYVPHARDDAQREDVAPARGHGGILAA